MGMGRDEGSLPTLNLSLRELRACHQSAKAMHGRDILSNRTVDRGIRRGRIARQLCSRKPYAVSGFVARTSVRV